MIYKLGVLCSADNPKEYSIRMRNHFSQYDLDKPLLDYIRKKSDVERIRSENIRIFEQPYLSRNKFRVSIHQVNNDPENYPLLILRGSPQRSRSI